MVEKLVQNIRLKKEESFALREKAFSLTKQAIMNGKMIVIKETDIIHELIKQNLKKVQIDENGKIIIKEKPKKTEI